MIEEVIEDDEESEVTFRVRYKTPVVERDEQILALQTEKSLLESEIPSLKERLTKATKQLEAEKTVQKQKNRKIQQAMMITEQKVSESIRSDHSLITKHPELISLLALFQDRDNFTVDYESQTVTPIQEECFLEEASKDIESLLQETELPLPKELYKERLGDVKDKLLEGLKMRWMKPERRGSNASQLSVRSKRDREDEDLDRSSKVRTSSPQQAAKSPSI